jgi:hypothetical protein
MLQLIDYVELLQQETYKMLGYERNSVKQQQMKQQFIQKRKEENLRRAKDNEPLLPLDEKTIEKELNMKPSIAVYLSISQSVLVSRPAQTTGSPDV